jgi:hypothetical protein
VNFHAITIREKGPLRKRYGYTIPKSLVPNLIHSHATSAEALRDMEKLMSKANELVSAGLLATPVDNENIQFIKGHWHNCDPWIKHEQFGHQSLTAVHEMIRKCPAMRDQ